MREYYNLPKFLKKEDYEECCRLVVADALANATVRAVYLMGGEWCLGVSDLDIVIVYKDAMAPIPMKNPRSLSEKAKFIFTHRYLSFNEKDARNFYYLYPEEVANLRLLYGEPVQFVSVQQEPTDWRDILSATLFDVLINKLLLFQRFTKGDMPVRRVIGELYSLVYTIKMVSLISGLSIDNGFTEKIKALRLQWFIDKAQSIKKLELLLAEGIQLVFRAVEALDNYLSKKILPKDSGLVFTNSRYRITFSSAWNADLFMRQFQSSIFGRPLLLKKSMEFFNLVLPTRFSSYFIAYASGSGAFSEKFRKALDINAYSKPLEISEGLKKRIEVLNNIFAESFKTDGLYKIPFSFGFSSSLSSFKGILVSFILSVVCAIKRRLPYADK